MQRSLIQQVGQVVTFTVVCLFWLGLSVSLMYVALTGLYTSGHTVHAASNWYGFLLQVCLFWLSLVSAGVGIAHMTFTRHWFHLLRNIMSLWQGIAGQPWKMMSLIFLLSYTALAFMVYVAQNNVGFDAQLLLAITSAALIMFSRDVSQQVLFVIAQVNPSVPV